MTHQIIILLSYTISLLTLTAFLGITILKHYKAKKALKQVQKKHAP